MQTPWRVLCTGYRAGGAHAEICSIWAAVTFPIASIRSIPFGPYQVSATGVRCHHACEHNMDEMQSTTAWIVSNAAFGNAFQYLVDLSCLWSTSTDLQFINGTNPDWTNPGTVYLLNDTNTAVRATTFLVTALCVLHTACPSAGRQH